MTTDFVIGACPVPTNPNLLLGTAARFYLKRVPAVTYFCSSVNLPGWTAGIAETPSRFNRIPMPGNSFTWSELRMTVKMDEDLVGWRELLAWAQSFTTGENHVGKYNDLTEVFSDGLLVIYSNSKIPKWEVKFVNMLPTNVSDVDFNQDSPEPAILQFDATFRYHYYEIKASQ